MKAILVIDRPNMCYECPLCHHDNECDIIGDVGEEDCVDIRCPLKLMPKPKEHNDEVDYDYGFIDGWNECLEEIEK